MTKENLGIACALLSGLFFGLLGYFGTVIVQANLSIYNMLFWRFLCASLVVFILLFPQFKNLPFTARQIISAILFGGLFYATSSMLYFKASQYIGTGLAMVIFYTYPTIVILINIYFYKMRISKIYYLAILIILIGLFCLSNGQLKFNLIGFELSILSALIYACYIISGKNSPLPPLLSTLTVSIGSMITSFTLALFNHSFTIPTDLTIWLNIAGIGIICTALPIVLLLKGLRSISAINASILSVLEPVFLVIFGVILLHEKINWLQTLGIIIVLAGAFLTLLSEQFSKKKYSLEPLSKTSCSH